MVWQVMRQSSVWGGGPEIVALSNALSRPIHVYELASNGVRRVMLSALYVVAILIAGFLHFPALFAGSRRSYCMDGFI